MHSVVAVITVVLRSSNSHASQCLLKQWISIKLTGQYVFDVRKNDNTGLVQPRNSTYNTLATNWQRWEDECDTFPFDIRSNTIPPNTSLCGLLLKNSARWHKVCELKINEKNIARNLKQKVNPKEQKVKNVRNVSKEIRVKRTIFSDCCFFCNSDRRKNVRNVSTKKLDRKIKECAQIQNDLDLFAKIGTGDLKLSTTVLV